MSRKQVVTRNHDWVERKWLDLAQAGSCDGPAGTENGPPNGSGEWPFWEHSILFSNGWELTLAFRDLEVEEMTPIVVPNSPYTDRGPAKTIRSA